MTAAEGAPFDVARRADFVRRSLWLLAGIPLLALASVLAHAHPVTESLLALLALATPWVFSALAWRYGSRYALRARGAWRGLSVFFALLGLAVVAGAAYLWLLASAFSKP